MRLVLHEPELVDQLLMILVRKLGAEKLERTEVPSELKNIIEIFLELALGRCKLLRTRDHGIVLFALPEELGVVQTFQGGRHTPAQVLLPRFDEWKPRGHDRRRSLFETLDTPAIAARQAKRSCVGKNACTQKTPCKPYVLLHLEGAA